mmetsp:Transcript_104727/g.303089  ORF Transcript_104727/g.303089 Transcript_104727/m.303089 type:complete len:221 (-) Transcript_104727:226-888(-)
MPKLSRSSADMITLCNRERLALITFSSGNFDFRNRLAAIPKPSMFAVQVPMESSSPWDINDMPSNVKSLFRKLACDKPKGIIVCGKFPMVAVRSEDALMDPLWLSLASCETVAGVTWRFLSPEPQEPFGAGCIIANGLPPPVAANGASATCCGIACIIACGIGCGAACGIGCGLIGCCAGWGGPLPPSPRQMMVDVSSIAGLRATCFGPWRQVWAGCPGL